MTKNKKGFTIIEVVLVLAIAGLIFLMVFIALPALQRSQRNTQREDDISRFLTAANDYQTNNNGKTPFTNTSGTLGVNEKYVKRYIDKTCTQDASDKTSYTCTGDEFRDPDGNNYKMKHSGVGEQTLDVTFENNNHTVHAYTKATCGDEGDTIEGTGERQYVLMYVLEGNSITCNDNH
ncbi:type II secretion system protein [Candidatus Saccharibacteria bacterium]|nr:type II secretion system protein [Candidatus Saccharibacteria bacterium]